VLFGFLSDEAASLIARKQLVEVNGRLAKIYEKEKESFEFIFKNQCCIFYVF
jgi:hypothetical protein